MALAQAAAARAFSYLPRTAGSPESSSALYRPHAPEFRPPTRRSQSASFTAVHLRSSSDARVSRGVVRCAASGGGEDGGKGSEAVGADGPVYAGVYGPWSIDDADRTEVFLYRAGLVTASSSFLLASSLAFLPADSPLLPPLLPLLDPLFALGASGLGLSLFLIHIYVTSIKRALQAMWLVGGLGALALGFGLAGASGEGEGVVRYVLKHGGAVWAVGPMFAALTGLVFKEGLCYGKLEAAALVFVIPTLMLSHLSGVSDVGWEKGLLAVWMALFAVFAARKFTQPIKDDLGDKSVFMFQAMPSEEQEALLARLNREGRGRE